MLLLVSCVYLVPNPVVLSQSYTHIPFDPMAMANAAPVGDLAMRPVDAGADAGLEYLVPNPVALLQANASSTVLDAEYMIAVPVVLKATPLALLVAPKLAALLYWVPKPVLLFQGNTMIGGGSALATNDTATTLPAGLNAI